MKKFHDYSIDYAREHGRMQAALELAQQHLGRASVEGELPPSLEYLFHYVSSTTADIQIANAKRLAEILSDDSSDYEAPVAAELEQS